MRAAVLSGEFRPCYATVAAAGARTALAAVHLAREVVKPLVTDVARLTFAIDDTPTERTGRHVQGAGVHHNPTPGPGDRTTPYSLLITTSSTSSYWIRNRAGP